ncbi:MAG: phage resistance protein [Planctomycetes bacterium]|nr:phage resistance protein [Planctomycetota bacterium]
MSTLQEIFDLPDRVNQGDFVLKLGEGVLDPRGTLATYVVTPQLRSCFDDALGFVRSAVESRSSKAAYLHGSFGSGKSHFMAVLHHLLLGTAEARAIAELAPVVAKHRAWMDGRKFLLVPYHLIGARDLESAILGGYVQRVQALHPESPLPSVYRAEPIFENARLQRAQLGDAAFFAMLNAGKQASGGWGKLASGWSAESFEKALRAAPQSAERLRLLRDLLEKVFPAYRGAISDDGERFLPLDEGLAEISRHAQSLGYDALLLFLDEFILWLASHASDMAFLTREGQKVAKLVEAQNSNRPVPIVSFVARQRDLQELVGDHYTGSEVVSFQDITKWWNDRFHKIALEDRNLPLIVERRILKPKSDAARAEIARACDAALRMRTEELDVLLSKEGDREAFQRLYPFPPVLVETLVAVSSLLQRERTALRILLTILVDRGASMELGDLVPIGDLFDFIAVGSDAFSAGVRTHFENAQRLYEKKLRPILEEEHKLRFDDVDLVHDKRVEVQRLRNDDRLAKTLLLAALVPEVPAFRSLSARRLATLNYSAIKARIPGNEGQLVLDKLKAWVSRGVGEIQIGEGPNPTISMQISGIDVESVLEPARAEDSFGNRIKWVKRLLFHALGLRDLEVQPHRFDFSWRGTKRQAQIVFGNVWGLPDESLREDGDEWKVVIDFPFDHEGKRPSDDVKRLWDFRQTDQRARTLVWLPRFFSAEVQRQLGRLCIIDHVLSGERFATFASRLHVDDRERARALLKNQLNTLQQQIVDALLTAYGLAAVNPKQIDISIELDDDEQFQSLLPGLHPRRPAANTLRSALENLLDQALSVQYPAHPRFEEGAKVAGKFVVAALEQLSKALQAPGQRWEVPKELRKDLRPLIVELKFGQMSEQHLLPDRHWNMHFERLSGTHQKPFTVKNLRAWIDEPKPMGLPRELEDLVIRFFAEQTNRSFFLHGGSWRDTGGSLPDELELRAEELPDEDLWKRARERTAELFGEQILEYRSASNLLRLEAEVQKHLSALREEALALLPELEKRTKEILPTNHATARLRTARSAALLVERLRNQKGIALCKALADAVLDTSPAAVAHSLKQAAVVRAALRRANWDLLHGLLEPAPEFAARAGEIRARLEKALAHDELAQALAPELEACEVEATRLFVRRPLGTSSAPASPPATRPVTTAPSASPPAGAGLVSEGVRATLDAAGLQALVEELRKKLAADPELRAEVHWKITRRR